MLLSSSNRKYPPFPLFSYFSVVVCLRCFLHHILSLIVYKFRENREFVFISFVQFMMSANSRILFGWQVVFVCLYITPSHYHHCANFIWRHWTYKMLVRYNSSSVWVRLSILSIFSQLSIIQYVGLCVFSLPISFVMIARIYIYIYTLSYYHHQIWSMNYYPLFRARSWNNGMCCMSFYILTNLWYGQIASRDIRAHIHPSSFLQIWCRYHTCDMRLNFHELFNIKQKANSVEYMKTMKYVAAE